MGQHRTRQGRCAIDYHRDAGAPRTGRDRAARRRRHRLRPRSVSRRPVYVSGDTVWYDGVAEVARRFPAAVVLPFAGSAQTCGPFHLTMDTNDVVETARAFADALIIPAIPTAGRISVRAPMISRRRFRRSASRDGCAVLRRESQLRSNYAERRCFLACEKMSWVRLPPMREMTLGIRRLRSI